MASASLPSQNPVRAEASWPPVVVGGVFQTGLNLMRDLIRKGVRVVGVDHDLTHQGFRSVYGKSLACPNPDMHPAQWVEFMASVSENLGAKPVFIPAADIFVAAYGCHADALQSHYLVSSPAAALGAALTSKETQYALAEKYGFPCLLKPRSPREWSELAAGNPLSKVKVLLADTPEQLREHYTLAEPYRPEAIAQEVIQGLGSNKFVYLSVYGENARLLGDCVVRATRDYPPFTGMPAMVKPVVDEEIASLCRAFLKQLNYRGICEFEVRRDARDGKARLVEINPRFSGTGDAAGYMGVETGWLHYLDCIGQPVTPVQAKHFDFHHLSVNIESNESFLHLLKGDLRLRDVLAPYEGPIKFYDLDFHDRALAHTTVNRSARNIAHHLRNRF